MFTRNECSFDPLYLNINCMPHKVPIYRSVTRLALVVLYCLLKHIVHTCTFMTDCVLSQDRYEM